MVTKELIIDRRLFLAVISKRVSLTSLFITWISNENVLLLKRFDVYKHTY